MTVSDSHAAQPLEYGSAFPPNLVGIACDCRQPIFPAPVMQLSWLVEKLQGSASGFLTGCRHMNDVNFQVGDRSAYLRSAGSWRPEGCERIALVLQGGGALGAYQAGVSQAMHEAGVEPDWVSGVSIGAINSAIIAGNPPKRRLPRLRAFWESKPRRRPTEIVKIAKPTVEISDKVRLNLEKFVWSSREK